MKEIYQLNLTEAEWMIVNIATQILVGELTGKTKVDSDKTKANVGTARLSLVAYTIIDKEDILQNIIRKFHAMTKQTIDNIENR